MKWQALFLSLLVGLVSSPVSLKASGGMVPFQQARITNVGHNPKPQVRRLFAKRTRVLRDEQRVSQKREARSPLQFGRKSQRALTLIMALSALK